MVGGWTLVRETEALQLILTKPLHCCKSYWHQLQQQQQCSVADAKSSKIGHGGQELTRTMSIAALLWRKVGWISIMAEASSTSTSAESGVIAAGATVQPLRGS